MNSRTSKLRRPYSALIVTMAAIASAGIASADVVLHPGTITGTIGLQGATPQYGSISVSGNASGFYGSTQSNGNTFSLTIEGGQRYSSAYAYTAFANSQFQISSTANIDVPSNGSVAIDLSRPSGTIVNHVQVTGGTLGTTQLSANAAATSEYYWGSANASGGADASLLFAAAANVSVSGTASVSVLDVDGALLCTTNKALPVQSVALAAGATVVVTESITVSPADCGTQLTGLVGVNGLPGGAGPSNTWIYAFGPVFAYQNVSGNNQTYLLKGLAPGNYYTYAQEYFGAPFNSYLSPPNDRSVSLPPGQTVVHDQVNDGVVAGGHVNVTGSWAGRLSSGQAYFSDVSGAGNAGASINGSNIPAPGDFSAVLTVGNWYQRSLYLAFNDWTAPVVVNSSVYFSDYSGAALALTAGAPATFGSKDVPTSEGQITFDVIEPAGSPVVGISNPAIYASRYDAATQRYINVYAYGYANNVDTPAVRIVGPPGTYQFDAYGTVNGSFTRFASSTLDLGQAVNTPAGTGVVITPKDSTGAAAPLTVDFANVASGGQTTVTISNVGPAAPADYLVLKAFKNQQTYIDISTSATYSGKIEVCLQYDPVALQLSTQQESKLVLQHYTCASPSSCVWEVANELYNPHSPAYTDADAHYFGRNGGPAVNTQTHTICGVTSSLSPFALMLPTVTQVPPTGSCVGTSTAAAQLSTSAGVCSVSVDNTNQLAGGCSGGGGGLLSCTYDGARAEALTLGGHAVSIVGTAGDGSSSSCTSYVNIVDREAPRVTCPAPVTIECAGAQTPYAASAACNDNCSACTASCGSGPFDLGANAVACNAIDGAGNKNACNTAVRVVDTKAPSLTVSASPNRMYPPNHKMVPIVLKMPTTDVCDPHPTVTCAAVSNEPATGGGSGSTTTDIVWTDGQLFLRSERAGTLNDRIYTITCTSKDASGNQTVATTQVTVPHSQ